MKGRKRFYYIVVVEEMWDYVLFGKDLIDGVNFVDSEWVSSILRYYKDFIIIGICSGFFCLYNNNGMLLLCFDWVF